MEVVVPHAYGEGVIHGRCAPRGFANAALALRDYALGRSARTHAPSWVSAFHVAKQVQQQNLTEADAILLQNPQPHTEPAHEEALGDRARQHA